MSRTLPTKYFNKNLARYLCEDDFGLSDILKSTFEIMLFDEKNKFLAAAPIELSKYSYEYDIKKKTPICLKIFASPVSFSFKKDKYIKYAIIYQNDDEIGEMDWSDSPYKYYKGGTFNIHWNDNLGGLFKIGGY